MLRFLCFCLAILPLLGACQLARMQVSPALATVEPFTVDRVLWRVRKPNDPLSFGSWRTTRIDVGWSESRSRQVPVTVSGKSCIVLSMDTPKTRSEQSFMIADVRSHSAGNTQRGR